MREPEDAGDTHDQDGGRHDPNIPVQESNELTNHDAILPEPVAR